MSSASIRAAAHEAEAALRRHGELGHARAIRRLLASHTTLANQASAHHDELLAARRDRGLADYRGQS